jgi:hypothetical protein
MNTFDLSPLWQSTVGFDRLTDLMEDSVRRMGGDNYRLITSSGPVRITTKSHWLGPASRPTRSPLSPSRTC